MKRLLLTLWLLTGLPLFSMNATPLSVLLGLDKPEIDLSDKEVDRLTNYQAEEFALAYGAPVTVYTSAA